MNSKETIYKLKKYLTEQSNIRADKKRNGLALPKDQGSLVLKNSDFLESKKTMKWVSADSDEYKEMLSKKL